MQETLEILSDKKLIKSIERSLDLKENKVLSYKEMLKELSIDEKEIWSNFHQRILEKAQASRWANLDWGNFNTLKRVKYDLNLVTWLVRTVLTEEDKRNLKGIAVELQEIRKLIEELTEKVVNLSDKELMKSFNASPEDLKENQVLNYKETLEKQLDIAEKEFRSWN